MGEISAAPKEIKQTQSVGQEFIEWAEQYWQLKDLIKLNEADVFNGEKCDYRYMRNVFISKINTLIKDKLGV